MFLDIYLNSCNKIINLSKIWAAIELWHYDWATLIQKKMCNYFFMRTVWTRSSYTVLYTFSIIQSDKFNGRTAERHSAVSLDCMFSLVSIESCTQARFDGSIWIYKYRYWKNVNGHLYLSAITLTFETTLSRQMTTSCGSNFFRTASKIFIIRRSTAVAMQRTEMPEFTVQNWHRKDMK